MQTAAIVVCGTGPDGLSVETNCRGLRARDPANPRGQTSVSRFQTLERRCSASDKVNAHVDPAPSSHQFVCRSRRSSRSSHDRLPIRASLAAGSANIRIEIDPEGLYNVQSISLIVSNVLGGYLLERLVYLDEKGEPKPWLANPWQTSDDGKTITFKLKPGKTFHDGTPFNAEAVKFLFDTILDPNSASPSKGIIGPLETVDAVDDLTVKFTFTKPFAPFLGLLGQSFFGFNSPTAVKAAGSAYARHPVGTGPFMFKSWTPGTEVVVVRNPNFKQFRPDAANKGATLSQIDHPARHDRGRRGGLGAADRRT